MSYTPRPLDTSSIALSDEILALSEKLAENTHENWAAQRMRDGWKAGPRRDDARKEHPGLVPYQQLSESEKQYDRLTAVQTLKAMALLGYEIRRK